MRTRKIDREANDNSRSSRDSSDRAHDRRHGVVNELRKVYFASAGDLATRYGVTFDRVVAHLWRARPLVPGLCLRSIRHVSDLVHAIACVDAASIAWIDLTERNESLLVRACRDRLSETDAIIFVRQLVADLKRQDAPPTRHVPSLQHYVGVTPLRNWLRDRLIGRLNQRAASRYGATAASTDRTRRGNRQAPILAEYAASLWTPEAGETGLRLVAFDDLDHPGPDGLTG